MQNSAQSWLVCLFGFLLKDMVSATKEKLSLIVTVLHFTVNFTLDVQTSTFLLSRGDCRSLSYDIKNDGEKKLCSRAVYPHKRCQNLCYMLQGWENMYHVVDSCFFFFCSFKCSSPMLQVRVQKSLIKRCEGSHNLLIGSYTEYPKSLLSQKRLVVSAIKVYQYLH